MTTKVKTYSTKRIARIVGVLFIIATVAGALSVVFLGPVLDAPDFLTNFSANKNQILTGAILDLIGAGAFVGLAIVIFPVLKKHNENVALGYVVARGFEAVPFIIANISLLALLTLSQNYVQANVPDVSGFLPTGFGLLAVYDWGQLLGPKIFAGLAGLPFYLLLYQSKLVPRFLSIWGLIGVPGILAAGFLGMFGLSPYSTTSILLFLPYALNEMVLAVWLIVKGFSSSTIAFEPA